MSGKPRLKQRAIITIDNDAVDYVAAAKFQVAIEAITKRLREEFLRADFDVRERRDARRSLPKTVSAIRNPSTKSKVSLDEDV